VDENETPNEAHDHPAPLTRPNILDQLALERELDRLTTPYEPPHAEDYHAY
jgi:hypothetical protein